LDGHADTGAPIRAISVRCNPSVSSLITSVALAGVLRFFSLTIYSGFQ
jgi:hypothetical protein